MNTRNTNDLMLIGVGGGGCRLVEQIVASSDIPIRALRVDTDSDSVREGDKAPFLLLGGSRLSGHGAGGDISKGRLAAQDDITALTERLDGIKTAFVVSCFGGGTGTGATGEIVHTLHNQGLTVICLATRPFALEGNYRSETAQRAMPILEEEVDSLLIMQMDELFSGAEETALAAATEAADRKLGECILLLWNILSKPGFISLDCEILHALVNNGGRTFASWAQADGDDRPGKVIAQLCSDPLLRSGASIREANALLIGLAGGDDMRLAEIGSFMKAINAMVKPNCRIEMGTIIDPTRNGTFGAVVLAFNSWNVVENLENETTATAQIPPVLSDLPVAPAPKSKTRGKNRAKNTVLAPSKLGQFENTEMNIYNGVNLDFPTYYRRKIVLEK